MVFARCTVAKASPLTDQITQSLRETGPGTALEIAQEIDHVGYRSVSARLSQMAKLGLVKPISGDGKPYSPWVYGLTSVYGAK